MILKGQLENINPKSRLRDDRSSLQVMLHLSRFGAYERDIDHGTLITSLLSRVIDNKAYDRVWPHVGLQPDSAICGVRMSITSSLGRTKNVRFINVYSGLPCDTRVFF